MLSSAWRQSSKEQPIATVLYIHVNVPTPRLFLSIPKFLPSSLFLQHDISFICVHTRKDPLRYVT